MDVKESIFMKRGEGENSYSQTSVLTQRVNSLTKPMLENAVRSIFSKGFHLSGLLNIADLGCAAGPNTFSIISTVKETVAEKSREMNCQKPELQFYLNDLPGNDFNSLFKGLYRVSGNEFEGVSSFVMGVPGSFHGRLFPKNSLHLVHSSYGVHWLSQAPKGLTSREGLPLNKGKIYISKISPPVVREAYLAQFEEDFSRFLNCRSEEVVPDGCMVLILHGRRSPDPTCRESCYTWELIANTIAELVSQGLVDEDKLDSFNVPYYTPSAEEVQSLVGRQGSFGIEHIETFVVDVGNKEETDDVWARGVKMAKNMRSFTESMMAYQFGEEILDTLYNNLTHLVVANLAKEGSREVVSIIVVLSKNIR